jgi:hypothetical protein
MIESFFKKCLPRVSEVRESLPQLRDSLLAINGINGIRIFGSLAEHYDDPNFRIKDVDIIAETPFHSGDLLSITAKTLTIRPELLEDRGMDPLAVKFSKEFTRLSSHYPLDRWVLSNDKKLLHWGPFISRKSESEEVKIEAEKFASEKTGFNLSKMAKSSDENRSSWYKSFHYYIQSQFDNMPTGWYRSAEKDLKTVLIHSIQLAK